MIGYNASDKVEIYQTLEWDRKCGGCYKGVNGSYNNTHIQFEMLEDNHTDESYFSEVLGQAIELCAYLCQEYGIPVENIVSHKEAGEAGYASMHGDPENWFKDMGYSMDEFRKEVAAMIEPRVQYNRGDVVALNEGVTTYYNGTPMASFVYDGRPLYVLDSDYLLTGITIDPTLSARTGTVKTDDIHLRDPRATSPLLIMKTPPSPSIPRLSNTSALFSPPPTMRCSTLSRRWRRCKKTSRYSRPTFRTL